MVYFLNFPRKWHWEWESKVLQKIACETIYNVWKKGYEKKPQGLMEIADFTANFMSVWIVKQPLRLGYFEIQWPHPQNGFLNLTLLNLTGLIKYKLFKMASIMPDT